MYSVQFSRGGVSSKYYRITIEGNNFDANSEAFVSGIETEFVSTNTLRAKLPSGEIGAVGRSTVQVRGLNDAVSNVFTF